MLTVETIGRIRREHYIKGKTIREISRDLKVSRNTVRKVLRSGETSFEYERDVQPRPKLGRWMVELDELLEGNTTKPFREQLTLICIFEELRGRGYDGGYDAVRRYARRWAKERGQSTAAAYVPLSFAPGEAYQFDWSHEVVLLSGVTVIVKAAHVRLCHSRMLFVRVYPRETQEMVFDAHDRAFALFKGACGRGIYDNMKTAVETIFVGKQRLYNRRFLQMCSHYLVDPVACTPASGWEKGQVENQVGLVRQRFFTPRLRFKNLDELNAWLLDKCIAYAKVHHHPELTEQTIWKVFEAERPKLVPYAGRFDGFHAGLRWWRRCAARTEWRIPMPKPANKRASETVTARAVAPQPSQPAKKTTDDRKANGERSSKQARVVAMLRSPTGTTIPAVMKATGWQQHSVRGFFAGVVQKKLRLKLDSKKIDGDRIYRIIGAGGARSNSSRPSRQSA